jgi:gamma-tubulin complex component 4
LKIHAELDSEIDTLPAGLYLQAFTNGLDLVLETYHSSIVELEKKFLRKPTTSLMFIFHAVDKFRPLFEFLLRLINGIKTQRLTGCQILQFLQDNALHGNKVLMEAVLTIQKSVYTIFIQQLSQWIIYGKFSDTFAEFFISHADGIDKRPTYSTQLSVNTYQSSEPSVNLDLWMYEVNYDMLPYYFPKSWAEKVLFIGQTVLMFNSDPLSETSPNYNVWGTREAEFFQKFHQLQEAEKLNVLTFEKIIDEVKVCVTEHLSEIAINDADLVKQLKLIKDFFMLGRGELFYEFIKGLYPIFGNVVTENTVRDINSIFHTAAGSVNIQDDELFDFELVREDNDSFSYDQKGLFHFISLRYKIKWPLHLLFPPKVLDKYNDLFRFLICIRKTQYDLQMVWSHHRDNKIERSNQLLHFRNKLMFLVDNLLYYLQVDVVESQFSIMMNKIQETRDFEQILRAHNVFLANVLGLCFLLDTVS